MFSQVGRNNNLVSFFKEIGNLACDVIFEGGLTFVMTCDEVEKGVNYNSTR
jgi:hypothetical protein